MGNNVANSIKAFNWVHIFLKLENKSQIVFQKLTNAIRS